MKPESFTATWIRLQRNQSVSCIEAEINENKFDLWDLTPRNQSHSLF